MLLSTFSAVLQLVQVLGKCGSHAWAVRVQAPDAHGVLGGQAVLVMVRHAVGQLPQPARPQQLRPPGRSTCSVEAFFSTLTAQATLLSLQHI